MSEFVDYLHEVFAEFGPIHSKRMFGGFGIYHDGLMFALVADDTLYLKVDAQSKPEFEALELPAFEVVQRGKPMRMSYHLAPEALYDDPELAAEWAHKAYAAARRSKA